MHLLYLDESGNEEDPADRNFVLAGAAIFERQTYFLSRQLDALKERRFPTAPPLEFHASAIRRGKGFWRSVDRKTKDEILEEMLRIVSRVPESGLSLFAAIIEKSNQLHGEEAVKRAVEEVCSRFDMFLKRLYRERGDAQRGLLIFSQGKYDMRAKAWVQGFREAGTRWGFLRNFSDIPYFAGASETRLLQVADLISYSTFLLYERHDSSLIRPVLGRFDTKDGVIHGLAHYRPAALAIHCDCPGCFSRAHPGEYGPWVPPSLD